MTEYWVSKKQYWCKYCSIWIRDDAPSRRQHETGLKHQGNKERFIRELYKGGNQAKREKEQEAFDIAKIEASANAAYAHDQKTSPSIKPSLLSTLQKPAASSSRTRDLSAKDKWANYSTAQQLGFDDEETQKSSYEVEQELKGRAGDPGAWETVEAEPSGAYTPLVDEDEGGEGSRGSKRKLGEYALREGAVEDVETWKLQNESGATGGRSEKKRAVRDPYEDEDWDPKKALGGLRVKVKEERRHPDAGGQKSAVQAEPEGALKRDGWSGKIEIGLGNPKSKEGLVFDGDQGGWVKAEDGAKTDDRSQPTTSAALNGTLIPNEEVKPELKDLEAGLGAAAAERPASVAVGDEGGSGGLFKKRRPPPSSRKK